MSIKRILWVGALLAFLVWGMGSDPARAQTAEGPVYIVQSGDTLTSIALRFGVTLSDLMNANSLTNADVLNVGNRLVIPGLPGMTGVLETRAIEPGESLRGVSRRYQIPLAQLVKLNRLVSPQELVVGAPLVMPVAEDLPPMPERFQLAAGGTLLEQAAAQGVNPWQLAAANQLTGTAAALPGDVLFGLAPGGDGPNALPAPIGRVTISRLVQGTTGVVTVEAPTGLTLAGSLGQNTLKFFEAEPGRYVALQGIYALATPEMTPLTLTGEAAGQPFAFSQMVYIRAKDYIFEYINVPADYIDPERTRPEEEQVRALVAPVTPEQYWEGVFVSPSPYPDCINSTFGNRRSYNGSAFNYFHGGVDYCGGTGTQIYAVAPGVVVFAGPLEIRGLYTLIDHGWGVYSGYMHQSEINVAVGDVVTAGQWIGAVGSTGRSTGPHLHWEVWVNGALVQPLDWLVNVYP